MPTISVLMPAYNAEHYIAEAIASVLRQSYRDFELLVLDDGSTDRTPEIVGGIDDPRLRYVRNTDNLRLPLTLNRGLELTDGELVARMDADDVADSRRFEIQVEYLRANPQVALVGSGMTRFDDAGRVLVVERPVADPDVLRWRHQFSNQFHHPTVMLRRAVLSELDLRYGEAPAWATHHQPFPRMTNSEDYLLFGLLALRARCANLSHDLLRYRVHPSSWSHTQHAQQVAGAVRVSSLLLSNVVAHPVREELAALAFYTQAPNGAPRQEVEETIALIDEACEAHLRHFRPSADAVVRIRRDAALRKRVLRSGSRSALMRIGRFLQAPVLPRDMEELRLVTRSLVSEESVKAAKRLRTLLATATGSEAQ